MKETNFTYLKSLNYQDLVFREILSDASKRRYYRFFHKHGSLILMERDSFNITTDRFYLTYKFFKNLNINLPNLYNFDEDKGYMVLEDLGDLTIINSTSNREDLVNNYLKSVELILKYQSSKNINIYPMNFSFKYSKFYNELIMTKYYYLEKYKNKAKHKYLEKIFHELTELLIKQKFLLNHRDYHSRNILVFKDNLYLIDFQDARLGPYTYDLASLIVDPYANIDNNLSSILVDSFFNATKYESYESYILNYNLNYLQRAIKILGTYAYQSLVNSNTSYLKYIPITLEKIKSIKKYFPKWEDIIEEVIIN